MTARTQTDAVGSRDASTVIPVPAPPGANLARAMVGAVGSHRTTRRPFFAHTNQDGAEVFSRDATVPAVVP
jgi:hypothetical protein